MKPVPRSRHFLAVLILSAVAVAYGSIAMCDTRLGRQQIHAATAAIKNHDPSMMANDRVFGQRGLGRSNLPLPQFALQTVLSWTSYQDISFPFRAMAWITTLIFLCGMYSLLFSQCRSWSVSLFVAILSSRVIPVMGEAFWGAGSLGSVTPQGIVVAISPWLVMIFLRLEHRWDMPALFLLIGLLGNIYLSGAVNLTAILLGIYLIRSPLSPRRWFLAGLCLFCALAGMFPAAWHHISLRLELAPIALTDATSAFKAFRAGRLPVTFDEIPRSLLNGLWLTAILFIPSVPVLIRVGRFRVRNRVFWVWFLVIGLLVSLGLHSLSLLVAMVRNTPPVAIDFIEASGLLMLPLYVLFAAALTSLFRTIRAYRGLQNLMQFLCVALLVGWLISSDNLRPVRHRLLDAATVFMPEDDKPRNVQRHRDRNRRQDELESIANWARENSDTSSVFITNSIAFRMLSRRAIAVSGDDVRYIYYLTPGMLDSWCRQVEDQRRLLTGETNAQLIQKFVTSMKKTSQHLESVRWWYVIVRFTDAKCQGLHEITNKNWGRHHRLYKLP